ncbi:MAG: hypothetical protein Q9M30_06255 [Mariprofundaceae bacterium]|nr:hypothetical protein [Mariprofundaceae bacterium]
MVSSKAALSWPELRFPPINLWVMPPWRKAAAKPAQVQQRA